MSNPFEQYKWLILGIGAILWSMGVCHIASTYTESSYTKEKLAIAEKSAIEKQKNLEIVGGVSKDYQDNLAKIRPVITTINKEIQREVQTNTIYSDCKSTDGVVREYERKLDLQ